jgi:hypothetical protein
LGQFGLKLVGDRTRGPVIFEVPGFPGEVVGGRELAIPMAEARADCALREGSAFVQQATPDLAATHAEEGVGIVEPDLQAGNGTEVGDLARAQVAPADEEVLGGHVSLPAGLPRDGG